jgi:hypothetical protein
MRFETVVPEVDRITTNYGGGKWLCVLKGKWKGGRPKKALPPCFFSSGFLRSAALS